MDATGNMVKVYFRVEQDEDGYPPVAVESIWAQPSGRRGEYVIDNVPFFARMATIGDIVSVREEGGNLWFEKTIHRSTNSLVRVVFFDRGAVKDVGRALREQGCTVEDFNSYNIMAVSIPERVSLREVREYLQAGVARGIIDYEEPILRHNEE